MLKKESLLIKNKPAISPDVKLTVDYEPGDASTPQRWGYYRNNRWQMGSFDKGVPYWENQQTYLSDLYSDYEDYYGDRTTYFYLDNKAPYNITISINRRSVAISKGSFGKYENGDIFGLQSKKGQTVVVTFNPPPTGYIKNKVL